MTNNPNLLDLYRAAFGPGAHEFEVNRTDHENGVAFYNDGSDNLGGSIEILENYDQAVLIAALLNDLASKVRDATS